MSNTVHLYDFQALCGPKILLAATAASASASASAIAATVAATAAATAVAADKVKIRRAELHVARSIIAESGENHQPNLWRVSTAGIVRFAGVPKHCST